MPNPPLNILFLCTHNSARSILAEALLNEMGGDKFRAFSAGSSPRENQQPNPFALKALQSAGISIDGLSSKSWDVFASASPHAPKMDLVITVCDNAAGEVCPFWPGQPANAHWGYADPSEIEGTDEQRFAAFRHTLLLMQKRLQLLVNLPLAGVTTLTLQNEVRNLSNA